MSALPEHIQYDATADELIVHGRRVSVAAFQQAFFTHGRWVQVVEGPGDRITVRSAVAPEFAQAAEPLYITGSQLEHAFHFLTGGEVRPLNADEQETCLALQWLPARPDNEGGTIEEGVCAWLAEYPEEGCLRLEEAISPQPDPAQVVLNNAGGPA
jgi:hypothetical protein